MNIAINWNFIEFDSAPIYLFIDTKFILWLLAIVTALRVRKLWRDKKRRSAKAESVAPVNDTPEWDAF